MNGDLAATRQEVKLLRGLARKQMEYANLPVMEERKRRWYEHNALRGRRPMLVMETGTFRDSIVPEPQCTSKAARRIESQLTANIVNHEMVDDDKVTPPYFSVNWSIDFRLFDLHVETERADDGTGRSLGHRWKHPVKDLRTDLGKLRPSVHSVDRQGTLEWKSFVDETIGAILPVRLENASLSWGIGPTGHMVVLMGMEYMLMSMLDSPDEFQELIKRVCDELHAFQRWQEQENLLTLNNEHHYVGAGSYGFTTELPQPEHEKRKRVTTRDLWLNTNSQESVGLSPQMYGQYIFPHYVKFAEESGLVYYGCCEPVHAIWDDYLSKLPNLRKVSISAWCDEQAMGERLRGSHVIYSRKPSPNFIGVGAFDEDGYRKHIAATLEAARGCKLEIIHRDIYSLGGDRSRAGKAIAIARQLIDELWE